MKPLLKYCGNHSEDDLLASFSSKADYVGVVFVESKRMVTPNQLKNWLRAVPNRETKKLVGLFVNPTLDEIEKTLNDVPLDIIQCHGHETPNLIEEMKNQFQLPVWKVIHHSELGWRTMELYQDSVSAYIIDSKVKGQWGGTGQRFDWGHIPLYIKEGQRLKKPVFIAGGIHPNNVEELLEYQPNGIDLSSGIEVNGRKDREMMKLLEERIEKNDEANSR